MTDAEKAEYLNLINLWNCTEPMSQDQIKRMDELDAMSQGIPRPDEVKDNTSQK